MRPAQTQSQHPALITVRTGSSRLPAKCLLPFGDGNVLDHVIERTRWGGLEPIVCTTVETADDVVESIARHHGARCFRGSVQDKLDRWCAACSEFGLADFHTVDADDPFFDPLLGLASLQVLREGMYDVVYPSSKSYLASVGYSLTHDIINRACEIKTSADTEMMWYHVEKVPGLRATELDVPDARIRDVRLTLDYEEDYWLLRTVLRILGPRALRREIEDLFLANPQLTLVNWFRNDAWKAAQEAKRI